MPDTMLSAESFASAKSFLLERARPLEAARFAYHFGDGERADVIEALLAFRNPDGGFGRGLEPDFRTADSSALATTVGLALLRSIDAAEGPEARAAVEYLVRTHDPSEAHWRLIPREPAEAPHAPWWSQAGRAGEFDRFSLNPTAEVLGYLYDHRDAVPGDLLAAVEDRVVDELSGAELEMHELHCVIRLLESERLPEEVGGAALAAARRAAQRGVARDPAEWSGYALRPLQVAPRPGSPLAAEWADEIQADLDYEIATQQEDGSWSPAWSWGELHPEAWEEAKLEWSGVLTIGKLLTLGRYGRLDAGRIGTISSP